MIEPINLTDETLDAALDGEKPVLLLLNPGDGLRGDFKTAFKKAAEEQDAVVIAEVDLRSSPATRERFEVGSKPVMIGWAGGEVVTRRSRPWGTDVPQTLDLLSSHVPAVPEPAPITETNQEDKPTVYNTPVNVTDETFQAEVIDSDLPVLVDFWAEWCGPCRMVAPVLDKLAAEFEGQVKIAKVNVDENPALSQTFQIRSIPNMMAIKEKAIVFNQPGALPEPTLRDLVQQLIDLEIPAQEDAPEATEEPAEVAEEPTEAGD